MRILLSYSRPHFDPDKKPEEHKYWGSSASILARTLYKLLSELGEVTYIEGQEHGAVAGQHFDLFVGIERNFGDILRSAHIKRSILWAVNMHPKERNQLLKNFARQARLPGEAFAGWDLVDTHSIGRAIAAADAILCVGNVATYNSYIKHGVPATKVKMLNYAVGETEPSSPSNSVPHFLYTSSEIGLRKGFDILLDLFTHSSLRESDFRLEIVGSPTTPFYERKLEELQSVLGSRVVIHGWVDSASEKYGQIMRRSDFIVFPALEEGQAGSILDAVRYGAIPLLSTNTGVDFSPLGELELSLDSPKNREILARGLALKPTERRRLRGLATEYYSEFHAPFEGNLRDSLVNAVAGNPYPKLSLVLPIFNKEQTIRPLLKNLDGACRSYSNVELHIIFDGCKDKTEEVVRRFYRKDKGYPVDFETTPDIFEVKTNNIGLRKSSGKYAAVTQDDIFIYDQNLFLEAVTFLDKSPTAAILGTLAGVNYYPRGTKLKGSGQIAMNSNEVYWRQDERTDPVLAQRIFEVDACMRGPLIFRKDFLEKHGYLDEVYAPLYQDDMDICFRARKFGKKVYCLLGRVANKSLTMAHYDEAKNRFWEKVMKKNTDEFYRRWKPTTNKDYLWVHRTSLMAVSPARARMIQLEEIAEGLWATARATTRLPRRAIRKISRALRR